MLCSVAGTVGAIVTCPLEVVKTRLQSSCSGFQIPKIAQELHDSSKTTCRTLPEQRRRLWTSSCRRSLQVVALSGYVPRTSTSVSLVQCLRHIVKYEGPMALFKGIFTIAVPATTFYVLHLMLFIIYCKLN